MEIVNNIIGLDTVKAYTNVYIDEFDLISNGWLYWRNLEEFCMMVDDIRLVYRPKYSYLSVCFSAAKLQNGANYIAFNFNYSKELIDYVNQVIVENVPVEVEHFGLWEINRMDSYVDYNMFSKRDLTVYRQCFSKTRYMRCKNTEYKTGNQAKNKSYSINVYEKKEEIKQRLTVNKKEKLILKNNGYNVLRLEVQIKNTYIKSIFGKNRKVNDLINVLSCKKVILIFMKKIGVDRCFISREKLFEKIDCCFSDLQSRNIKRFLDIYNKYGLIECRKIYKASTINTYLRLIKNANLNPIYISNKKVKIINMLYFTITYKCKKMVITKCKGTKEKQSYYFVVDSYYLDRGG